MQFPEIDESALGLLNPNLTASTKAAYTLKKEKIISTIGLKPTVSEIKQFLKLEIEKVNNSLLAPENSLILPFITRDASFITRLNRSTQGISAYLPELNVSGILDNDHALGQRSLEEQKDIFSKIMEHALKAQPSPPPEIALMIMPILKMLKSDNPDAQMQTLAPELIRVYFLKQHHDYLTSELAIYINKKDDETTPFRIEPLPEGWVKIYGKLTIEQLWTFFSFLWEESCGDKDGETFLEKWQVRNLLKYGLAYPTTPQPTFTLNLSPKRKIGIIYSAFYWLHTEHQNTNKSNKADYARFLCHHFSNFESISEESVYSNIRKTNINSQNFEFRTQKHPKKQ